MELFKNIVFYAMTGSGFICVLIAIWNIIIHWLIENTEETKDFLRVLDLESKYGWFLSHPRDFIVVSKDTSHEDLFIMDCDRSEGDYSFSSEERLELFKKVVEHEQRMIDFKERLKK